MTTEAQTGDFTWFSKSFAQTHTGIDNSGYLSLWLYVSDATKLEGGQIDIDANQVNDNNVEIAIADYGVGISDENLKHIFEPFYTTKGKYGTGLGLSITYGIVEKLGGSISVKSKLMEGTRFTVRLPINSKIL